MLRRRWPLFAAVAAVLACATVLAWPQLRGWSHWRSALAAVEHFDDASAGEHLAACLQIWPDNADVRLLAARTARRLGAFEQADEHLLACERADPKARDAVELERAMMRITGGDLSTALEDYLQSRAESDPARAPLAWEALAVSYTRSYRVLEAFNSVDRWLEREPGNVRAFYLRASAWRQVKQLTKAVPDYQRVVAHAPGHDEARYWLAQGLLESGRYADALAHLEHLRRHRPDDADLQVPIARCLKGLSRFAEARGSLDAVLEGKPDHGPALRARGEVEMIAGRPAEAEAWLRRAALASPHDYLTQWLLYQSLQQQEKSAEAKDQLARVEALKERVNRLNAITSSKMSVRPHDPGLHCELGDLLNQLGQPDRAAMWWQSALQKDPNYAPAHRALAAYYAERGDDEQAAPHRQQAELSPAEPAPAGKR